MTFFSLKSLSSLSTMLLVSILLSGCVKNSDGSDSTPKPTPASAQGGGGIDGSGGNVEQSSVAEVESTFKNVLSDLPNIIRIIEANTRDFGSSGNFSSKDYDLKYGSGAKKFVMEYLYARTDLPENGSIGESLPYYIEKGNIQIQGSLDGCREALPEHDGWAQGGFEKGKVCIDLKRLTRIPPKNLQEQIFLLLIHETSHLAGFSEDKALYLQALMSNHPGIYNTENRDPDILDGGRCSKALAAKNIRMFRESQYWMGKKKELVKMLSGGSPGGRSKAIVFWDNAEFLDNNGVKFDSHDMGSVYATGSNFGISGTYFEIDTHQSLMTNIYLHLQADTTTLGRISSQIGTDAQCDPRVLMANLLANAPEILGSSRIPDFQKILEKEKEILDGEPHEVILQTCDMKTAQDYVQDLFKITSWGLSTNTVLDGDRELTLFRLQYDKNGQACRYHFKCDPLKKGYEVVIDTCTK